MLKYIQAENVITQLVYFIRWCITDFIITTFVDITVLSYDKISFFVQVQNRSFAVFFLLPGDSYTKQTFHQPLESFKLLCHFHIAGNIHLTNQGGIVATHFPPLLILLIGHSAGNSLATLGFYFSITLAPFHQPIDIETFSCLNPFPFLFFPFTLSLYCRLF